jgi:hypothetical protein
MKPVLIAVALAGLATGCATLQQMVALRQVAFRFDRVAGVEIAGVPVGPDADYSSIGLSNVARLASAIADGRMPLEFTAHVAATNPADNTVAASLVNLAWTLFVEDRRTVSGLVAQPFSIAPGQTADVPVLVELDLMQFWEGGARDLFDLAVGIAGGGGTAKELRLELVPTIDTSLGPMRYPTPIVVRR